jgi:hypothetical protein
MLPAIHVRVNTTLTNTMMTGHYRRRAAEAAYVLRDARGLAARKLAIGGLRRRNTTCAAPYRTALVCDCGDFGKNLEDCVVQADYAISSGGVPTRRAQQAARHRRVESTVALPMWG